MVRKNNLSKTKKSIIKDSNALVGSFSFIKKCGWNMVLLIPIGKINSFTVSRCFLSHIHSLIIGILRAAEQFQKFKICNSNYFSCSTYPLHIQGQTKVVFLANIGNFTSRRRIFGLRFLYFVFWHFCISIIFCFYF